MSQEKEAVVEVITEISMDPTLKADCVEFALRETGVTLNNGAAQEIPPHVLVAMVTEWFEYANEHTWDFTDRSGHLIDREFTAARLRKAVEGENGHVSLEDHRLDVLAGRAVRFHLDLGDEARSAACDLEFGGVFPERRDERRRFATSVFLSLANHFRRHFHVEVTHEGESEEARSEDEG